MNEVIQLYFFFYADVKLRTINDFLFSAQMDNVNFFKVKKKINIIVNFVFFLFNVMKVKSDHHSKFPI